VSPSSPLLRERHLLLASLLLLAAASWAVLAWQRSVMGPTMPMGLTMGLAGLLFLAIWVVMMVAMMFPTVAPMVLMFARVHVSRRQRGQSFVPTWVFVAAYLVVWTLFGVLAYMAALGAETLAGQVMWLMANGARLGGAVLVAAGLYQLSPLKRRCLSACRSPLQFLLGSWREGYRGAFRMGLEHGAYCLVHNQAAFFDLGALG
jgi:predicted metal-binding membrane protein